MKTKILFFVVALTFALSLHAAEDFNDHIRSGLSNTFKLFDKKEYQQVAFFGGDVLRGKKPYSNVAVDFFKQNFKDSNIGLKPFPDQGGSWYGAFRVARGEPVFGATVHNACIEFIDFCSSDQGVTEKQAIDSYEGIVRGLLSFRNTMDVVFVYTLSPDMFADFKAGKTPPIIEWAEKVAAFYNLPSVNLAKYAADKINSGEISEKDFFETGIVPTPKGEKIYAEKMLEFLDACLKARTADGNLVPKKLAQPISPTNMQSAQIIAYEWGKYPKTWKDGQPSPNPYFRHLLVASAQEPGGIQEKAPGWVEVEKKVEYPGATASTPTPPALDEYSLTFKGKRIGLLALSDPTKTDVAIALPDYSLDGSHWLPVSPISVGSTIPAVWISNIAEGLDVEKEHVLKLRVSTGTVRIGAFLVDGVVKSPLDGMTPLEKADAAYATIPPIQYTPPTPRWTKIPKTMEKLKNGPSLKIVMLGDSIMGDTGSSQYDKILEREYPNCKIEKIMSLRGSTGCWWYKDENRVEDYVLKHNPDLLMIGGISQRGDTEAIRSVIRQVREKQNPEIMLITPVFGSANDPHIKNWTYEIDGEKYAYRADMKKLAEEENCEFVDLTGEFWKYIQDSGKCYGWFMRDVVHANDRGFQVIGRLLVRYLL